MNTFCLNNTETKLVHFSKNYNPFCKSIFGIYYLQ